MNKETRYHFLACLACVTVSVLFCLKFSVTTSPFYHIDGQDSAIFYIIGKYWAEGSLPYVDLWDHKGPMIFFINCLGYLLTGDKIGILFIQMCSLSIFTLFTYKSFRLVFSEIPSFLLSIAALFWLACSYEGGNLTEEYLLPFQAIAFYHVLKWIQRREAEGPTPFNPWVAGLFGVILAFCFLTRLTNALGSCGVMLGIGLTLLFDKQWKNLIACVLYYCLGFAFLCLPFVLYFACHQAMDEMLFGTFFYNLANIGATSDKNSSVAFLFSKNHILFIIMSVNCFGLLLVSAFQLCFAKEHRTGALVWFLGTLLLALWLLRSEPMSHYRTTALPFFCVLIIELLRLKTTVLPWACISLISLLLLGPVFLTLRKFNSFSAYFDNSKTDEMILDGIRERVPSDEMDTFMSYSSSPSIFLLLDVKPIYRNFSFPETQAIKSEVLKQDILTEYSSGKAKWILCYGEDVIIKEILESKYELVLAYPDGMHYLWRHKTQQVSPLP